MSNIADNELFDRFVDWLDGEYSKYSHSEIEVLWQEFMDTVVPDIQPWRLNEDSKD
jgi:hypothetical protein